MVDLSAESADTVNVRQFGAAPRQPLVRGANRSRNFRVALDGAYKITARGQTILETTFLNEGPRSASTSGPS